MEHVLVYMTVPDLETARRIGRAVVEERLAACVNILGAMESLYWWEGTVHNDLEVVLVAKTRARLFEELRSRVVGLHPYEAPCIVAVDMCAGHGPFLHWITAQTLGPGSEKC